MKDIILLMETPPWTSYYFKTTQNNNYQRYNQSSYHRSMPPPPSGHPLQVSYVMPECFCYAYGYRQCLSPYHFPQYQYSNLQSNLPHQFKPKIYPSIPSYGQLCNSQFYTPPFRYLVRFGQNFQENIGQGNRRLAAAKRSVQPPGGIIKEGQFFFSNKIYVHLSLEQQVRLGAVNPGTQNKCRKIRPWLVLWKLNSGNVIVV